MFLPLQAVDRPLGTLELGYSGVFGSVPGQEGRANLAAFGNQVAIAVHAAVAIDNARLHEEEIKQQRLEQELIVAQAIQQSLLPLGSPQVPGWQFAAAYCSARVVSGDFYDFCELHGEPRRIGIVVVDVDAGRVIYANAGHNRPLLCRAAGDTVAELRARGILLGAFENIELEEQRVDVAPGDALVFYTDGITDALNAARESFGEARLATVIRQASAGGAQEILQAILDAVAEFVADQEQADDITCVMVKRAAEASE